MIKLLHLADVHIGMENYGRLDPATGLSTRVQDFLDTLDEAVERAISDRVDLVAFAGDIYKTRDPSPTHQREFARRVVRLTREGIAVVLVAGNHDIPAARGRATSVDIFRVLDLSLVTVARRIELLRVETRSGPIQIVSLPWLTRSAFLAEDEYKNKSVEELLELMVDLADKRLADVTAGLDPSVPAALIGHVHVFGARAGAERLLTLGNDPILNVSLVDRPNVDYVGLGHIHKHQTLATGAPPVVYSGSINRVDFGEEDEPKGFVLAEVERGSCNWEFVPVKARPFLTIRAEPISEDPTGDVQKTIFKLGSGVRDAVVRLQLVGPRAKVEAVNEKEVRAQLREAYYLLPFQREYTDKQRPVSLGEDLQGRTPLDILDLYFERRSVKPERRQQLLACARELMADEPAVGSRQ
ncbi:MAG TPA: exonuclease SbcCD subunit D [Chloroflexota bacterium]|nr:exonuclease SbcCD subunit D [Chloroflexota bacterium]